jgi:Na+/H+-dicarboxylate symporter
MRLYKSWLYACVASLLAIVILLCVGAFLSLLPTGIDVPAALTTADSPHVNQGTNGDWHSLDPIYFAVPAEEAEEVDKHPVEADLLTALLLLALSFGASVVWLLTNGWGQGAFRSLDIDRRRWLLSALEARPFWGVFRL